jgi:F-type H+-transporting ATPase subunit c
MMEATFIINFLTIAAIVASTAVAVAFGQGRASFGALEAMSIQPMARNEITRCLVIALALMETAAVVAITLAFLLLMDPSLHDPSLAPAIARIGIACAICCTGATIGYYSWKPAYQACMSIARQPFFSKNIFNLLLITLSLLQTPILLAFIIAWLIKIQAVSAVLIMDGVRLCASGLVIGLGSIGPIIGLSSFSCAALEGIGRNRKSYSKILMFTFISEAVIETAVLFTFMIALIILFISISPQDQPIRGVMIATAALCMGISSIAPGINSGKVATAACKEIAARPEHYPIFSGASIISQVFIDTLVLNAAITSLIMLLLHK